MSSPTSDPDGNALQPESSKVLEANTDPADFTELHQFVTFPRTNTTWSIKSRLSNYSKPEELTSNSFHKPGVFKVVIAGTGHKCLPPQWPRIAILKVHSLFHTVTKHNKDKKTFDRKTILASSAREELVALNQLTLNQCSSAPKLVDYKVVKHDEGPGKEVYVSFILMTECPGVRLAQIEFWMLPQWERDLVRQAFRAALSEIHACWVVIERYEIRDLIWNAVDGKLYFTKLTPSSTYGLTTHLPARYLHRWHNDWFDLWDLTTKNFIDPHDRIANPKEVPTKDEDDASQIAAWDFPYPAAGVGTPAYEKEGESVVDRCVGKKHVEIGELIRERGSRGFLGRVMRRLGRV